MARIKKELQSVDREIAAVLAEYVEQSGISRRELALATGMSANRLGIILRQEPPPATVGEVGLISRAVGVATSTVIAEAESRAETAEPSNVKPLDVGGSRDIDLTTVPLHNTPLAASTDNTPIDPTRGEG
ncbi:helix-turn-helix domain-containing protein [Microbacterium sp. R1]|uniref:helix-turn-helix domain-containing protein n=1 Tax=Microbacterium sp. R1 TaxID=322686 RepID=UPI0011C88F5B|nr:MULTISPECIES: helix-turn-helix transcriptional regulator [Terrabacteria group]MBE7952858.1 helix-turn-helix domain-containing protein [Microbacterium sp. R1]TXF80619.1 hypothetical protein FTX54_16455 [Alkalicoccus halolimnae]